MTNEASRLRLALGLALFCTPVSESLLVAPRNITAAVSIDTEAVDFQKCICPIGTISKFAIEKEQEHGLPNGPEITQVFHDAIVTAGAGVFVNGGKERAKLQYSGCAGINWLYKLEDCQKAPNVVVLTQGNAGMYYHFVAEILSRLSYVQQKYPSIVNNPQTVYHIGIWPNFWQQQWAQLVGLGPKLGAPKERMVRGCWQGKTVVYPPSNGCCGTRAHAVQGMQRMIFKGFGWSTQPHQPTLTLANKLVDRKRPVALMIQRCRANKRIVLNEDLVLKALQEVGFDVIIHSDRNMPSISDQCRKFNRADLVIGPHGAGLTNILCTRPGTPIVELQQSDMGFNGVFMVLAEQLNMPYYGIANKPPYSLPYMGCGHVNVPLIRQTLVTIMRDMHAPSGNASAVMLPHKTFPSH